LHYRQSHPDNRNGGWNGFSTTAEFYALFEGDPNSNAPGSGQEERRGYVPTDGYGYGFLVGPQYGPSGWTDDGQPIGIGPLQNRSGQPLVFTKEFNGLSGNGEANGIRILKYHPSNGAYTEHLILFRYADAHLMKVEAIVRGGASSDNALALYNELRTVRDASPLAATPTLQDILDERGRELYIEGWRRNDQVRFGTFNADRAFIVNTDASRNIFPIPANALSSNPNLVQNPGY
jgi:starch-binding outer membrane protein, SusD/RagB family